MPTTVTRCVTRAALASGEAFFVLSENPLSRCPLLEYRVGADRATFRIVCPGPNMGRAVGVFDLGPAAYRGSIEMNMGGKNMTMSETQVARRIGDCE